MGKLKTLGCEHTMQCICNLLLNDTPETYFVKQCHPIILVKKQQFVILQYQEAKISFLSLSFSLSFLRLFLCLFFVLPKPFLIRLGTKNLKRNIPQFVPVLSSYSLWASYFFFSFNRFPLHCIPLPLPQLFIIMCLFMSFYSIFCLLNICILKKYNFMCVCFLRPT